MKIFRKCISVFLAVLFLAYGGGIGFSLHNCEHCHEIRIFMFNHPDCCPASKAEHHGELTANVEPEKCCSHESCPSPKEISSEAVTAHCHQCCLSEYQFYKINSKYVSSQYHKVVQAVEDFPIILFNLLQEDGHIFLTEATSSDPLEEIPPLIPGGNQFLIFSHQLLFYA